MTIDDNYKYGKLLGGGGQGVPKNPTVQDSVVLHGFHVLSQFMRPVVLKFSSLPKTEFSDDFWETFAGTKLL